MWRVLFLSGCLATLATCATLRPLVDCPHQVEELPCRRNGGVYLAFENCARCVHALEEWDRCSYISQTSICRYPLNCNGDVCVKPEDE